MTENILKTWNFGKYKTLKCFKPSRLTWHKLIQENNNNWLTVWLKFYFLFIKFPPKFTRTGSAYIFTFLFVCGFSLYNSVIPSSTEPVFVSNKTIGYKETHHFYQNKILKIKKRKINLTLSIEMWRFLFNHEYCQYFSACDHLTHC